MISTTYNYTVPFYNEKLFLLTTRKLAHSKCFKLFSNTKDIYHELKNQGISLNTTIDTRDYKLILNEEQSNLDYYKTIDKIWESFLNKKEKRDIVILYRHPLEHFLSSFIQDYTYAIPFFPHNGVINAFIYYFLEGISASPTEKKEFLKRYQKEGLSRKIFYDHNHIYLEVIKMLFEYYITMGDYHNGSHYSQWLTFISGLYYSNNIDRNKFKFIDIYKSPIQIQLQKYFEEDIETKVDAEYRVHNFLFDFLKNLVNENKRYQRIVETVINSELVFYNKIKNNQL